MGKYALSSHKHSHKKGSVLSSIGYTFILKVCVTIEQQQADGMQLDKDIQDNVNYSEIN